MEIVFVASKQKLWKRSALPSALMCALTSMVLEQFTTSIRFIFDQILFLMHWFFMLNLKFNFGEKIDKWIPWNKFESDLKFKHVFVWYFGDKWSNVRTLLPNGYQGILLDQNGCVQCPSNVYFSWSSMKSLISREKASIWDWKGGWKGWSKIQPKVWI